MKRMQSIHLNHYKVHRQGGRKLWVSYEHQECYRMQKTNQPYISKPIGRHPQWSEGNQHEESMVVDVVGHHHPYLGYEGARFGPNHGEVEIGETWSRWALTSTTSSNFTAKLLKIHRNVMFESQRKLSGESIRDNGVNRIVHLLCKHGRRVSNGDLQSKNTSIHGIGASSNGVTGHTRRKGARISRWYQC